MQELYGKCGGRGKRRVPGNKIKATREGTGALQGPDHTGPCRLKQGTKIGQAATECLTQCVRAWQLDCQYESHFGRMGWVMVRMQGALLGATVTDQMTLAETMVVR